jgi:aminopeptidase N
MIRYYAERFGPFPYEKLAHVQSATRFGGMENVGAIFYSERAIAEGSLSEGTVAHETVHQWFGDAVTPHDWHHVWLSEGFATYFGMQYFEAANGASRFRELRENSMRAYLTSEVTNIAMVDTTRVPNNDLMALLNANSYNKGGAVLHMLRGLLGDGPFFDGLQRYYREHEHGTARTADLQRALEAASAQRLDWFFEQWVYRPGHPVFRAASSWDAATQESVVTLEQVQPAAWPTFRVPLELAFAVGSGEVRHRVEVNARRQTVRVKLTAEPSAVRIDPDGWILKEIRN